MSFLDANRWHLAREVHSGPTFRMRRKLHSDPGFRENMKRSIGTALVLATAFSIYVIILSVLRRSFFWPACGMTTAAIQKRGQVLRRAR